MTANVFCILLGFVVGFLFRRAWFEANTEERLERMKGRGREGR